MNAPTFEEFNAHLNRYQNARLPSVTENGVTYTFMGLVAQLWNLIDGAAVRRVVMTRIVQMVGLNNMPLNNMPTLDPSTHEEHLAWVGQQNFNNHTYDYIRRFTDMMYSTPGPQALMYEILDGLCLAHHGIEDWNDTGVSTSTITHLNHPAFINYLNNINANNINNNNNNNIIDNNHNAGF